jgi:hypothetical protein
MEDGMTYKHKPALDKPYITLTCNPYEHDTSVNTRITIEVMEKDLSRDDMIEVLETFMKSMGYHFSEGEHLGIEYE